MTLWMLHEFSQEAYELGCSAKETDTNPFEFETNEWYSWNKGKNNNDYNQ